MVTFKQAVTTTLFLLVLQMGYCQVKADMAYDLAVRGVEKIDEGKIDEGIKLLEQAQKLDPDRFDYPYEIAYAKYAKKDYKGAIKVLEKIKGHPDATDRFFQLLGNSYDMIGNSTKAFEIYDEGLEKFPNSGMMYLEKGNVHWGKKEYAEALPYYEKGIEVDPTFPSNYYRAARIYCNSNEEVWGMIYGEIFMNLERGSDRTAEISKLLYDTYKSQISFTSDSTMGVSFCQSMTIDIGDISDTGKFQLPFCLIYEPTLLIPVAFEKKIDINSLDRIRSAFVQAYFSLGHNKTHPNILFDYQNTILEAGYLDAYNHWILMKGDEDGFDKWEKQNHDHWEEFIEWYTKHAIQLDDSHKFYREQY